MRRHAKVSQVTEKLNPAIIFVAGEVLESEAAESA